MPAGSSTSPAAGELVAGRTGRPRWLVMGLLTVVVMTVVDLSLGAFSDEPSTTTNVTGTYAVAPVLTAAGGTRRQTLLVGFLAVLVGASLCVLDGVHLAPALTRTLVVVVGAGLALLVTAMRDVVVVQLQDRREAARTLQAAMLTALPEPDHLELASRYLPASSGDQVGGDWYDGVTTPDGSTVLVIGDVTGHDISAAASMGQLRAMLRAYAVDRDEPPSALLGRLDRSADQLGLDALATVLVVRIEQPCGAAAGSRRLRWSSAGHPPPLLVHADGHGEVLDGAPDVLLGVEPGAPRTDHVRDLPPGSTLLLHTDGLVERRGEDVSAEDLLASLGRCAGRPGALGETPGSPGSPGTPGTPGTSSTSGLLEEMLDGLLEDVLQGGHADDVAVLAVRLDPQGAPRPAEVGVRTLRPGPSVLVSGGPAPRVPRSRGGGGGPQPATEATR